MIVMGYSVPKTIELRVKDEIELIKFCWEFSGKKIQKGVVLMGIWRYCEEGSGGLLRETL